MQNKLVIKTIFMKITLMVTSLLPSQSRTKILIFSHELYFNLTSFQKKKKKSFDRSFGVWVVVCGFFPNKKPLQVFFYQEFQQYQTVRASTKKRTQRVLKRLFE